MNIKSIKEIMSEKNMVDVEIYRFNSEKKILSNSTLDYLGNSFVGLDDNVTVEHYSWADKIDYEIIFGKDGMKEVDYEPCDFDEYYPNGVMIVVIE